MARETFGIQQVVARIYDPGRAEVYQRLGITTVATVKWTADQVLRRLLPAGAEPDFRDPSRHHPGRPDAGPRARGSASGPSTSRSSRGSPDRLDRPARRGHAARPARRVIQEGDLLHLVMREENAAHAYAVFDARTGGAS